MNKITHTLIASVAAVLLLAGCSAAPAETVEQGTAAPAETVEATPEPLVADEAEPETAAAAGDEVFLTEVRIRIQGIKNATDEQLITAGHEACELYTQGETKDTMRLIEGEEPDADAGWYWDSMVIASWAPRAYCPEYDELG